MTTQVFNEKTIGPVEPYPFYRKLIDTSPEKAEAMLEKLMKLNSGEEGKEASVKELMTLGADKNEAQYLYVVAQYAMNRSSYAVKLSKEAFYANPADNHLFGAYTAALESLANGRNKEALMDERIDFLQDKTLPAEPRAKLDNFLREMLQHADRPVIVTDFQESLIQKLVAEPENSVTPSSLVFSAGMEKNHEVVLERCREIPGLEETCPQIFTRLAEQAEAFKPYVSTQTVKDDEPKKALEL